MRKFTKIVLLFFMFIFIFSGIPVKGMVLDNGDYDPQAYLKDVPIVILCSNDYLYSKDSDGNEVGTLVPVINLMRERITSNITILKEDTSIEKYKDSEAIIIETNLNIYKDDPTKYETLISETFSPILIGGEDIYIQSINDAIHKNVGFLYNLEQYENMKSIIPSHTIYDSIDDVIEDLNSKTIDMAIIPQNEKLKLTTIDNLSVHLKLTNQPKTPIMFSKDSRSSSLFKFIDELINSSDYANFDNEIYSSENEFEKYHLKSILKDDIETVKKQFETIDVNLNTNVFPYSYLDDGEYKGLAIQILDLFKDITGIDYNIINLSGEKDSYNAIASSIKDNTLQLTSTFFQNSKLNRDFAISPTIYKSNLYVVKLDSNKNPTYAKESYGTSTKIYDYIRENFSIENLTPYNVSGDLMNALKKEEIDGIVSLETFINYMNLNENNNLNFIIYKDLNLEVDNFFTYNKNNQVFNRLMDSVIRHFNVFNPGNKDTLVYNTKSINLQLAKEAFNKKLTFFSLVTALILTLVVVLRFKLSRKKEKNKESEEIKYDFIDKAIKYCKETDSLEILKAHITDNSEKTGVLITWTISNHILTDKDYDKENFNKFIEDYSKQIALILPEGSLNFYSDEGKFTVYNDNLKNTHDADEFINIIRKKLLHLDSLYISYELYHNGSAIIYNYDTSNIETLFSYSTFTYGEAKNQMKSSLLTFDRDLYIDKVNLTFKLDELQKVIDENQLFPVYQPIFNIQTNELYGFEGLSRTINKNFSNIVELLETSIIGNSNFELSELMKNNILKTFSKSSYIDKHLFVNIDASDIDKLKVHYDKDIKLLENLNISSKNIVMEVTEGYKITDYDYLNSICNFYKEKGIKIALDDYGTGYSNLTHLIKLKPHIIKLDRQLISAIHEDTYKQSIVKQFVELSKEIDLLILGEGIETKEELDYLKSVGITLGQGYYLGRPGEI